MSEPPVCVAARWPPLAPESDGDRDRPGPNSARRCPSRASLRLEVAPTHSRRQGRGMGVPGHTHRPPAPLGVPIPGLPPRGQGSGSPGTGPAACAPHLSPAPAPAPAPLLPAPPPRVPPPLPSPAEHAQPGTRIAGSEAGGRAPAPSQPRCRCPPSRPRLPPGASRCPRRTFASCRG